MPHSNSPIWWYENHGHSLVCWHGNSCYDDRTGSYVHADGVHPFMPSRIKCREGSVLSRAQWNASNNTNIIYVLHLVFHTLSVAISSCSTAPTSERPLVAPIFHCLSTSEGMWSFFTGFGLDRKPRWGFPQQTHRCRKVPAPSPGSAETPWGLWGSGTGKFIMVIEIRASGEQNWHTMWLCVPHITI